MIHKIYFTSFLTIIREGLVQEHTTSASILYIGLLWGIPHSCSGKNHISDRCCHWLRPQIMADRNIIVLVTY